VELLRSHLNLDPELTQAYNLLADLRFEDALNLLHLRVKRRDSDPKLTSELYTLLGYAYFNIRKPEETVESLRQALRHNPRNDTAYFFLAQEYFIAGNKEKELECLQQAVAIRPTFVSALRMLAEFYKDLGDNYNTVRYYERIVELMPNSGYYRYQLYKAYEAVGDFAGAEADVKALKKLEPNYLMNDARLGDVYLKQRKFREALDSFTALRDRAPNFYLGYLGRARVFIDQGDLLSARTEVERARSLNPNNKEVKDAAVKIAEQIDQGKMLAIKRMLAVTGVLILMVLLVYFYFDMHRKKYVISILTHFNQQIDELYEQDELAVFILDFFTRVLSSSSGILLHYNRQNNELISGVASGINDASLLGFKVICGSEVANWVLREKKPVLDMSELQRNQLFEEAFPSLASRLRQGSLDFLLPLKEKDFFWGFLAVGFEKEKRPVRFREYDLLVPLVTSATQALETLYLYESSMVDETTGLYNKRYFRQTLGVELKRADRYQQPCSLVTFDIDDFKKINDTYGHAQGDLVLKEIGAIVRSSSREGIDTGARTGGEEFFIILPATSNERAVLVAQRLRASVEENAFEQADSAKPLKVTISVGVATYPIHAASENELVHMADEAQYLAKKSGKNKVCLPEHLARADAQKLMKKSLFLESRFDNLNIRDEATKLYNFTYFSMRLKEEIRRTDRYRLPCSVLLVSIENPPPPEARGEVMKAVGTVLKESLREGIDTPARMDGERFIIAVPETDAERCAALAARLSMLLEGKAFARDYRMSVVMAVSCYPTTAGGEGQLLETLEWALKKARLQEGPRIVTAPLLSSK
jgi:diguanylate cyclase (GGDEF)-like protein